MSFHHLHHHIHVFLNLIESVQQLVEQRLNRFIIAPSHKVVVHTDVSLCIQLLHHPLLFQQNWQHFTSEEWHLIWGLIGGGIVDEQTPEYLSEVLEV